MPVSKDFRVKKGLVVGENVDATSGNVSAVNIDASGTFSAGTFEPANVTATGYVSSPSISADNFYGNITDATYSDLTIDGTSTIENANIESIEVGKVFTQGTLRLDTGKYASESDQWTTSGVTLQSNFANVGDGSTVALFSIPMAKYRSGKCAVQAVAVGVGTAPDVARAELTEMSFIHDGTEAKMIEYGTVGIGSTEICSYDAVINGSNVEIRATASSPTGSFVHFVGTITQLQTTQI
jgi:hypothetical protein